MALETQSSSAHNQLLGKKIRHPASTNFDDDDFETPTAKRFKRSESTDSTLSRRDESGEEEKRPATTVRPQRHEIPDSEAETDEEEDGTVPTTSRTGLEVALPPVKTDKEAIAEYEAARAAESQEDNLHVRIGRRKWIPGKSSIYVDAFNLALETVLEEESHLFDEAEIALFDIWKNLSYEGQYLYVRLFLRKTAAWHRINRIGYYGDIADLEKAVEELLETRALPAVKSEVQRNPGESEPPADTVLGSTISFADGSKEHIKTLEEASSLLLLDELKAIAKEAKIQGTGKNKQELLKALRRTSSAQTGLDWRSLKRTETEDSATSETDGENKIQAGVRSRPESPSSNRDSHFLSTVFACTGPCIRLSASVLKLFERVHLVFYRSTEWTEKSLTTIILARILRRNFPPYIVSRSANIFTTRSDLLEFEASLRTQFRIDNILEFNGTVRRDGLAEVKEIFEEVYPRWKVIVADEQRKEDRVYESGEGAYLRRFSPAWVYTRIVHKGTYVLGRFKEHEREHRVLCELLEQRLFHTARRGAWYQRKALLEEHYMWALQPNEALSDEAQKKHWKRISLQTCEEGLRDRDCHLIYHYDLQKRVVKLERSLNIPKREQHDFGHVRLAKPLERTVHGIRVEKQDAVASRPRHVPSLTRRASDGGSGGRRGAKTIWIDEREGGGECSVEAMCLSWYRDQGWRGFHSEGGIVRTLFGYLFFDVLFTYVPNVFQTAFQTCPLDLHTDAFYPSRASEINHRLVEIANGEAERIIREVSERESDRQTCIVGLDWNFEIDDLLEIVDCFEGEALATVCKVMAQEYQQRGGGIPDLFLWKTRHGSDDAGSNGVATADAAKKQEGGQSGGEVMFAEVKSENDRLSDTQRLWIHVLTGAGIKVELCNAAASEVRTVTR